jgi:hypothetical protein
MHQITLTQMVNTDKIKTAPQTTSSELRETAYSADSKGDP